MGGADSCWTADSDIDGVVKATLAQGVARSPHEVRQKTTKPVRPLHGIVEIAADLGMICRYGRASCRELTAAAALGFAAFQVQRWECITGGKRWGRCR